MLEVTEGEVLGLLDTWLDEVLLMFDGRIVG